MDKKLLKAMNEQINKEMFSAYLYLGMAVYLEKKTLLGCSKWMQLQAKEEMEHAMKIFHYLLERGCEVELDAIAKPSVDYSSVKDVFQKTLKHEQFVTASINKLYETAVAANDNAAGIFLQWFVAEQVEEESHASEILGQLDYIKDDSPAMLMLDKALGART
ncbi:MAG TPA: ferritin [Candidatus Omnitrophota bacterium]|nr:ferritin [Candidatus Omnitrophota bacterium]HPN87837.1 ferritin [Candidatus Omnitrophota bacterium]